MQGEVLMRVRDLRQGGAIVLLGCGSLWGCSYADGARYTVDGWVAFASTASPPSDAGIQLTSVWSHSSAGGIDIGGSSSNTSTRSAVTPVGVWTATNNPRVFSFETVLQVARPSDGIDPESTSYVTIQTATYGIAGQIVSQDIGDEKDGWYPIHVAATFDFSGAY